MRALSAVALASVLVATAIVSTRDPDDPWSVAALIVTIGAFCGTVATMLQLRRRRGRARVVPPFVAARRSVEIGMIVALVLWLRAVDGLSIITGLFVVGAFGLAEAIISARPASSR